MLPSTQNNMFSISKFFSVCFIAIILLLSQSAFAQSNSVTLNWTAPGDDGVSGTASYYDIRYATSNITEGNWNAASQVGSEPSPQTAGNSESFLVTGLLANTTYYFAIKVSDEAMNWSAISNVITKTTELESTPPALIADLGTSSATQTSIDLSWTSPGDDGNSGIASQYDIRYSTSLITDINFASATSVTGEPSPQIAGTSESMTISGLNENTTYYFAIRTADDVPNWSGISNVVSGATSSESVAPTAIANLVVSNPTDQSARLSWTAPGDDGSVGTASQYSIRYSTSPINNGNWNSATVVGSVPAPLIAGSPETFVVIGLNQETTYYFAIKTSDEVPNWSALSNVISIMTLDMTPPATIIDLSASTPQEHGALLLGWTAPGDDQMNGAASMYEIRYSANEIADSNWLQASLYLTPPIPQTAGEQQSVTLTGLNPGQVYFASIKSYDNQGNVSPISNLSSAEAGINISTDIDDDGTNLPNEFSLGQNYPNPFNPSTTIRFSLPNNSNVDLSIYNVEGRKVITLIDQSLSAGEHLIEWDGKTSSGSQAATGMYIYRIHADNFTESKKMVFMK